KARTLGERLQVSYAERSRLRLQTIGPCDMTQAGMALIRKQKKRQKDRLRRQLRGGESRGDYLAAHHRSITKPWEQEGISRRTYYYRLKAGNCTSPHQVNLTKTELALVQRRRTEVTLVNVSVSPRPPLLGMCRSVLMAS